MIVKNVGLDEGVKRSRAEKSYIVGMYKEVF